MQKTTSPTEVKNLVVMSNDGKKVITTSLKVAEVFGEQHYNVIRDIEALDCSENFRLGNFYRFNYLTIRGETKPMVEMTRDGLTLLLLAMGFTGSTALQFKKQYIAAFDAMEAKLQRRPVQPRLNADQRLLFVTHCKSQLADRKEEAQPKVEYYNKFAKPDGSSTFSSIAKFIGWEPFKFTTQLRKDKVIYEQDGLDIPFQKYVDKGFFEVSIRSDGNYYQAQTRITAKGVHYLVGRYGKSEQQVESKKQPTTARVMPKLRLIKTSA
jgi:anti-repressor protein